MKKIIVLFLFTLVWMRYGHAQCPSGTITLSTQAEVDDFVVQYPNCTHIQGELDIDGSGITGLDSLYRIESVLGNFNIRNTSITSLAGLENLKVTSDFFAIRSNDLLVDLDALESLEEVEHFQLRSNDGMEDVTLTSLIKVRDRIEIRSLPLCTHIEFPLLDTIPDLSLRFLDILPDFSGLANIQVIEERLTLFNLGITSLAGFDNLKWVDQFVVEDNANLTSLAGCPMLDTIKYQLEIDNNDLLTDISAFNTVDDVGREIVIVGNASLDLCNQSFVCDHLSTGKTVNASANGASCLDVSTIAAACGITLDCPIDVTLTSQADLTNFLVMYPSCTQINGALTITGTAVTDISGLSNITRIGKTLSIENTGLTDLAGLENLEYIGDGLEIRDNASLTEITTFDALEFVDSGDFFIVENNALLTISGFNALTEIRAEFRINENSALQSITGFTKLRSANGFELVQLPALQTLDAFNAIETISNEISIEELDLSNANFLNALQSGELMTISNLPNTSFNFFNNLEELESLTLSDNELLVSISGFSKLKIIKGDFELVDNFELTDVSGFAQLENIVRDADLDDNELLPNLEGFSSLVAIGGEIILKRNDVLSTCAIQALCTYLENGGILDLLNNATGCNTEAEISQDCTSCPNCFTLIRNIWTGAGDGVNWSDANNWSEGIVPVDCHDAIIPNSSSVTIDIFAQCQNLTVQNGASVTNADQVLILGCVNE